MKETDQLKKLMEAIDVEQGYNRATLGGKLLADLTPREAKQLVRQHKGKWMEIALRTLTRAEAKEELDSIMFSINNGEMADLEELGFTDADFESIEEGTGDNIKRGLQGKVSKLEHAKRMGREAGKSGLRTLEVLSEFELDTLEPSLSKLVEETKTDIEKYLSILRNI